MILTTSGAQFTGFKFINESPKGVVISVGLTGTLYQKAVKPGETWILNTGKVWFTIWLGEVADSDFDIVAGAIGDAILGLLTGGVWNTGTGLIRLLNFKSYTGVYADGRTLRVRYDNGFYLVGV